MVTIDISVRVMESDFGVFWNLPEHGAEGANLLGKWALFRICESSKRAICIAYDVACNISDKRGVTKISSFCVTDSNALSWFE